MLPTSTIGSPMEFTLRMIGVWPDSSYKNVRSLVWTVAMVTSQIFQYWYLLTHIKTDTLPDFLDSLSLCFSNTLVYLKLNVLWLNRRMIFDILATMTEDWDLCASISSRTQMMNKAIFSHRFLKCMIGAYTTTAVLLGAGNILAKKTVDDEQVSGEWQLWVKMRFPFEYKVSPTYEIVVVTQCIMQYTVTIMAGMLNALIVTLMLHIAGQIEIMCQQLLNITAIEDKHESRVAALRALVNKHQRIIAFTDSVENVFCYIALMQFLSNTLVICFLGFLIVTSLDSNEVLLKAIPYYVVVNLEAFILCFTGEYLSSKSRFIGESAYASLWYELKPAESRILLLMILKSQRQLTMTAGKFVDLSLESFTGILKASASYISVLHAMY